MSAETSSKKRICSIKCHECGHKYSNLYNNGLYHCGSCLEGGMITAYDPMEKKFLYANLFKDKELLKKIDNSHIHGAIWMYEKLKGN